MSSPKKRKFNILNGDQIIDTVYGSRLEFTQEGVPLVYNAQTCIAVLPGFAVYEAEE